MNALLLRAVIAAVPGGMLLAGSAIRFSRTGSKLHLLQLAAAASLLVVIFALVCEALRIAVWMGWGREGSPGHYLDLMFAVLGLVLFPVGYYARALVRQP